MNKIAVVVVACLLQACLAGPVCAQDDPQDPSSSWRRLGAVRFAPTLTFAGPGIDTNVFNENDEPKQDWTARINPASEWLLRAGRGVLTAFTGVEYQYYATYDNQRAWNTDDRAKLAVGFARLMPFVSATYLNARMRPGYEIDIRARTVNDSLAFGTEVRLLSKTTFVLSAGRSRTRFDEQDSFLGTNLSLALDRRTDLGRLEMQHRLSSLTTLVVRTDVTRDRFDDSHFRDADSLAVMPGFQFKPFALIKGDAFVGYRRFRPLDPSIPDFKGVVASLDLAYTVSATRFAVRLSRDVAYSFAPTQPYYLLTDASVRMTHMITQGWDVDAATGWQRLAYIERPTPGLPSLDENGVQITAGVGRWWGRTMRLGFDVTFDRRYSPVSLRGYRRVLAGFSVKYGLKP